MVLNQLDDTIIFIFKLLFVILSFMPYIYVLKLNFMKKSIIFTLVIACTMSFTNGFGQDKTTKNAQGEVVYTQVDHQPEFPGGTNALFDWIGKNLKYPGAKDDDSIEGNVIVEFVISKTGRVVDPVIKKDGVGHGASENVLEMMRNMPAWKPGYKDDKPVNVKFTLPITFKRK